MSNKIQQVCGVDFQRGPAARRHEETCNPHSTKMFDLSDPVILLILKNLDAVDLMAVAGTSRRMRALAKDLSLWRRDVVIKIEIPKRAPYLTRKNLAESIINGIIEGYLNNETTSLTIRNGMFEPFLAWQLTRITSRDHS